MSNWLNMILEDRVDPETFHQDFPWAAEMIGCPHDFIYHAEGDPWTHTMMVVDELVTSEAYLVMSPERQGVLRLAAWFHDIAKPATTEVRQETYFIRVNPENGAEEDVAFTPKNEDDRPEGGEDLLQRERVGQPGHAPLGASMAYQALLDAGADVQTAREVHTLVFWHQRPFFLMSENSSERRAIQLSIDAGRGSWRELLTLCRADNRGRASINSMETLEGFDLLEMYLEDLGDNINCDIYRNPWPFETEEARLKFLRSGNKGSAFFMPENPAKGRMILMSGLPGSGKDTLIKEMFPGVNTVSLDDIRGQMDVGWNDNQGQVIQAGFEAARVEMRAGHDFIWNATGLSRQQRQKIIGLARDYDYLIEGVSIDIPLSEAKRRNAQRDRAVPDAVMDKLSRKREPMITDEVHSLKSVDINGRVTQVFGLDETDLCAEPEI